MARHPLPDDSSCPRPAEALRPELSRWYVVVLACALLFAAPGCHLIVPDVSHMPAVHNPFPQLGRVAVAPFFNQSDEPTVDGRRFAMAYYAELQAIPGFEVVPLGVVEEAIVAHAVDLSSPGEARRLAGLLGVDAVVIGSVTDFTPYYPPRCGMRVEWYTANPGMHEIPPGYGLPWGTPEEEYIPPTLVYEAEMALARAEMKSQTPDCDACAGDLAKPSADLEDVPGKLLPLDEMLPTPGDSSPSSSPSSTGDDNGIEPLPAPPQAKSWRPYRASTASYETAAAVGDSVPSLPSGDDTTQSTGENDTIATIVADDAMPPRMKAIGGDHSSEAISIRPPCIVHHGPVMTHTEIYHGHDPKIAEALETYVHFRHDERFGGWQTYLQRSEDFIRFCCHLHLSEMLSARGGAGETQVVWQWPTSR